MSGLIAWLEKLNASDNKARAMLRRSLAFAPGEYIPAYPYVEPFLKENDDGWRRTVHYLVAALWAAHWREGRAGPVMPLARACARHQLKKGSASMEQRFIHLLDADQGQLPYRLRQMVTLLGDEPLDFQGLLNDLLRWNSESKWIQTQWARDFYHTLAPHETPADTDMETTA